MQAAIAGLGGSPNNAAIRCGAKCKHLQCLLSACEKSKDLEKALPLFEEMQLAGIKPDVITYSALISACEKGQDLPKALCLCEDLQRQDITPEIVTYSALISACEKGKNL